MAWDSVVRSASGWIQLPGEAGVAVARAVVPRDEAGDELLTVENPGGVEIIQAGDILADSNPLPNDEIIRTGEEWVTLIDDVELNVVTGIHSEPYDVRGYSGCQVHIYVNSSGTPTSIRILPRFSPEYDGVMLPSDAIWSASEEGLWASLAWEDTDTVDGEWKTYYLPCAGQDWVMFSARGVGTTAVNVFRVSVIIRKFRGAHGVAHA